MTRCGWCHGDGCKVCTVPKRPYFPPKKKRREELIATAHKHNWDFLDRAGHKEWFMCGCGKTKTIYVD